MSTTTAPIAPNVQALTTFFSALQEYPDFIDGLDTGRIACREIYGEDQLTPTDIQNEIDDALSHQSCVRFLHEMNRADINLQAPFIYLLGFAIGELSEG